mgnify:CR=1 FL=1
MEVTIHSTKAKPIPLGFQALSVLIQALPEDPDLSVFYFEQASHPSSSVRAAIASKSHLSPQTIHRLAQDPSSAVLEALLYNPSVHRYLNSTELAGMMSRSVRAAELIAHSVFSLQDPETLIQLLISHSDPEVRFALASSIQTPSVLEALLEDEDSGVVNAAKRSLQ